jgi:hypothetical protein
MREPHFRLTSHRLVLRNGRRREPANLPPLRSPVPSRVRTYCLPLIAFINMHSDFSHRSVDW